jgi:chemotaxis protein methyltransferase CheR
MDKGLVQAISELIYAKLGIHIANEKFYLLESKLERLIAKEGYANLGELYTRVKEGDLDSLEALVRYITTGHTFFFREKDHFDYLAEEIKRRRQSNATIWCAASSTGEEVYSIAITLLEHGITEFKIVASDINVDVLERFNRGVYHVGRFIETPPAYQKRYFTRVDAEHFKVSADLRKKVSIKKINLMEELNFAERFDYVFCRNVLIYFDEKTRNHALANVIKNLKPGGLLFLGHTEALLNAPNALSRVSNSVYLRS